MGAKGRAGILFAAGILTVTLAFPAYGAKQKPIKSIDLEIRAESRQIRILGMKPLRLRRTAANIRLTDMTSSMMILNGGRTVSRVFRLPLLRMMTIIFSLCPKTR